MGKVLFVFGAISQQVEKEKVKDSNTNVLGEGSGPTFQDEREAVQGCS